MATTFEVMNYIFTELRRFNHLHVFNEDPFVFCECVEKARDIRFKFQNMMSTLNDEERSEIKEHIKKNFRAVCVPCEGEDKLKRAFRQNYTLICGFDPAEQ